MPELVEQMYCSQQIVIPPKFPYILKRYCKAAIKTQPYDLLRWSFEYFKALAEHRSPPVKLRLEYPVYSTEGGLTRGCLKVLAIQLSGMTEVPLPALKAAWQGFCLDQTELKRILCLCEVYLRAESVPFLHFLAVAGGLLTKSLTHTMILLCESLTKEPDGGSAAIPVGEFLTMYRFLAFLDASKDVKYYNGYKEGDTPPGEEEEQGSESVATEDSEPDDAALKRGAGKKLRRLSQGVKSPDEAVEKKLKQLSMAHISAVETTKGVAPPKEEKKVELKDGVEIIVYDEDGNELPYVLYGEPPPAKAQNEDVEGETEEGEQDIEPEVKASQAVQESGADKIALFVAECYRDQEERLLDLEQTFDEIETIVNRFKSASYDLGMVAGRQMSTTSGEFIVQHIEKEIMDYINEQIAVLPDPDLKKKKAKPEEVEMIKNLLETFLDENMDIICPEVEEVEEEEQPIPEITLVYAVPGIGGPVDEDMMCDFVDYIKEVSRVQADVVMPRNIRHFLCPPLETYIEHKYEEHAKTTEEVPTTGLITD